MPFVVLQSDAAVAVANRPAGQVVPGGCGSLPGIAGLARCLHGGRLQALEPKDRVSGHLDGGGEVVGKKIYDPKAADYSTEVQEAKDSGADAIALIGFDESSKILTKMVEQGVDISSVYGVDGNMGNALAENFEAGK